MNNQLIVPQSVVEILRAIWDALSPKRRWQFYCLIFLTVISSVLEVVSIGAAFPFLGVITAPQLVYSNPKLHTWFIYFGMHDPSEILLPITIFFVVANLFAGVIRLMLLWLNTKFTYAVGAEIGGEIYSRTLYQPYIVHVQRNSSDVISGITFKVDAVINSGLVPIVNFISGSILLISILITLYFINPIIMSYLFGITATLYAGLIFLSRRFANKNSKIIAKQSSKVIQSLQEGLGGIRDVILSGTQALYCQIFTDANQSLKIAQSKNYILGVAPKNIIELLGICVIASIAYLEVASQNNTSALISTLGALAIGAQRLFPVFQQCYSSITSFNGGRQSLVDSLTLLRQPVPRRSGNGEQFNIAFHRKIALNKIFFRYGAESPWIIDGFSLEITKGDRIGIVGHSGSGKSTLVDLLMGLLIPNDGSICIDDSPVTGMNLSSWHRLIGHVPQFVYIADTSVMENIAFGVRKEHINFELVQAAAKMAQLDLVIEALPFSYLTQVGERGASLSGGQRQRLGIARALYQNANIIVFDEATSALDPITEKLVLDSIAKLDPAITIIMISHNINTLKNCNRIIDLSDPKYRQINNQLGEART